MKGEKALVILLGRLEFDESIKIRIFHIVKNGVDWYDFLNYCIKTNMVCLVYKNMIYLGIDKLLPTIIKNNMRYHYEQNAIRNRYLLISLNKLSIGLAAKGIMTVPTKGIKFLHTIYEEDPGVRLLNDIDILACHSDKEAIHDYMKANNFFSYLINNEDAFCVGDIDEKYHFYINFTEMGQYDDLRIDFDYTYPADFLREIHDSHNYIYEFCYLCKSYYSSMMEKSPVDIIDKFNYIKLVDMYEYYKLYLAHMTNMQLRNAAADIYFLDEVDYVLKCFEQLHLYVITS